MRLKYTRKDLQSTFYKLVFESEKAFVEQRYSDGIKLIKCAAEYQYHVNIVLAEKRLDNLIIKLSKRLSSHSIDYKPTSSNIIVYDSFAWDNRGLTQQYLDALCNCGKYNIMLLHNTCFGEGSKYILEFCRKNKVITKELGNGSYKDRENRLLKIIKSFKPEKVLYHLYPSDILPLATFYAFKEIKKYQINLTDHAFWLGASLIDYSFEFRNWGVKISTEKRGLQQKQLLLLPYYPWQEDIPFQGFPKETDGKIKVFSGGAFYKFEGGDGIFFEIIKRVLIDNPKVCYLLAGDGNRDSVNYFIKENNFEHRLFLLGDRLDINEVFQNVDIYINTYPMIGGLMSQFAAINAVPILTYRTSDVEDIVCIKKHCNLTSSTVDELCNEAKLLIQDAHYRQERGLIMKSLIITKEEFRQNFNSSFENGFSFNSINAVDIDEGFFDSYIKRLNEGKLGLKLESLIKEVYPKGLCWKMKINLFWPIFRHKIHVTRLKIMRKR